MSGERTFLPAVVGPRAAWVLVREYGGVLRQLEARGQGLIVAGQERFGRELLAAVGQIREAGRQRIGVTGLPSGTSVGGSSGLPSPGGSAESSVSSLVPGLTTREVADRLDCSPRNVLDLRSRGRLVGRLVGREWLIDEVSVAEYLESRRTG